MSSVKENINNILNSLTKLQTRNSKEVRIIAVSKKQSVEKMSEAIKNGLVNFGESYVQEAIKKIIHFSDVEHISWHFLGPIQSNKTKLIAENFDWVQSVDRIKVLEKLNHHRPNHLAPLNVLIQININDEASKSGIHKEDLSKLIENVQKYRKLKLRGIMAIPRRENNPQEQAYTFESLFNLFETHRKNNPDFNVLSMGMSNDWEKAIHFGSNMVRIGTSIFGARNS